MLECKCKSTGHNIDTEQEATATNRNRKRNQEKGTKRTFRTSRLSQIAGTSRRRPFRISRPNHHCLRWAVNDGGPLPPCCLKFCVRAPGRFTHTHTHLPTQAGTVGQARARQGSPTLTPQTLDMGQKVMPCFARTLLGSGAGVCPLGLCCQVARCR